MSTEYLVRLRDGISSAAKTAADSVARLSSRLAEMNRAADKATASLGKMGGPAGFVGAIAQGNLLASVLQRIGSLAVSAGKGLVTISGQREMNITRLTNALGSKEEAEKDLKNWIDFADKTPFSTKGVVDAATRVAAFYKNRDDRSAVIAAISDLAVSSGKGDEGLDLASKAISDILTKGKLQGEEIKQLANAGLQLQPFYKELIKLKGIQGNETQARDKLLKVMGKGGVSSSEAVYAFLKTRQQLSGGTLGSYAMSAGDTITGHISNISSGFEALLQRMDSSQWPTIVRLKGLAQEVEKYFKEDTDEGRKLGDAIKYITQRAEDFATGFLAPLRTAGGLIGDVTGALGLFNTKQQEASATTRFLGEALGVVVIGATAAKIAMGTMAAAGQAMKLLTLTGTVLKLGWSFVALAARAVASAASMTAAFLVANAAAIGAVAATVAIGGAVALVGVGIAYAATKVVQNWQLIKDTVSGWASSAYEWGSNIVRGIVQGIQAGAAWLKDAITGLGGNVAGWFRDKLQIRSPSKVFAELGSYIPMGLAQGIEGGQSDVARAINGMVSTPAFSLGGGGMGGSRSIQIGDLNFHFAAAPQDPQQFAQLAGPMVTAQVRKALEEMELEV